MKNKTKLLIALIPAFLILTTTCIYENYAKEQLEIPTMEIPLENVDQIGEFWISVPAAENRDLSCDVSSVSFEGDDATYLILPEDVDEKQIVYYLRDTYDNYVTRVVSDFTQDVVIAGKQIVLVESQLPMLFIQTEKYKNFQDLVKAEDKETLCYGNMFLSVSLEDAQRYGWATEFVSSDHDATSPDTMFLRARGNGTWAGPMKKPFSLCLERAENLLGMGKNKNWNLMANSQDKTLLKNYVFNQLADNIGMQYVPKMQNVELYVNGNYQGVYLLTTKVSVDKKRVNLSDKDFLINWGAPNPVQRIGYESSSWFVDGAYEAPYAELLYPEDDSNIDEKQEIIQRFISAIEDTSNDDFQKYMDMESMVKYYWVQEASMNYDASFRSTYSYYKNNTGKIYMGPVWDMDLTLGTIKPKQNISFSTPEGWKIRNLSWYVPLFEHEEFATAVREAYFEGGIREELFKSLETFESEKEQLGIDGEMNFRYWKDEMEQWAFHYDVDSYEEQVDEVIDFYRRRLEWIDEQMKAEMAGGKYESVY